MARLQTLIDQLEAALDQVDAAKARLDTVRAETAAAIAKSQAALDRVTAEETAKQKMAEEAHAKKVQQADVLKTELRRDFDALLGNSGSGRVRSS